MKTWTEPEIARVAALAKDYSAREIAERMGFTKNQIIGVIRRNGIKLPNRQVSRTGEWYAFSEEKRLAIVEDAKARGLTVSQIAGELGIPSGTISHFTKTRKIDLPRRPKNRPAPSRLQYGSVFTTPSPNPVIVVDRRRDQCAWPLDLPEGTMMCGELALEGKSYCAGHYRKAYAA